MFILFTNFISIMLMKNKFIALALCLLFVLPCALRAHEVVIQLQEVIGLNVLPGDSPLDDPSKDPIHPTRPTDFRATIDGNSLSIQKCDATIPSAQAIVVNAATGGIVVNENFTNSLQEQISASGVYVLHIETEGGALVGQFIVE